MKASKPWRQSGLRQIERELKRLDLLLQRNDLAVVDRLFWQGRRRELKAAAWLVGRLLGHTVPVVDAVLPIPTPNLPPNLPVVAPSTEIAPADSWERLIGFLMARDPVRGLENCTDRPLELDILRLDQRQRLIRAVAEQSQETLTELQGISSERLLALGPNLLADVWMGSAIRFFGRYYSLNVEGRDRSVIETLAIDREQIMADLSQIPLVWELFQYILCQQDIYIDNRLHLHGTVPADEYTRHLLANMVVRIANGVLAPFLNRFGELEPVKQQFYHPQLLATRDLARFRNHLSWQYYLDRQYYQPVAMFESRHRLLVLRDGGIYAQDIYAPRRQELEKLRGLPWLLTIGLELRDAIAPLARATTTLVGNALVYILTEVVGRGLGLVGRGIVQGLGQALQEKR
jgi:Protein of unknown function (DUF3685)